MSLAAIRPISEAPSTAQTHPGGHSDAMHEICRCDLNKGSSRGSKSRLYGGHVFVTDPVLQDCASTPASVRTRLRNDPAGYEGGGGPARYGDWVETALRWGPSAWIDFFCRKDLAKLIRQKGGIKWVSSSVRPIHCLLTSGRPDIGRSLNR